MIETWFIEALDARGGLCFTSRRGERQDPVVTQPDSPQETVFFAAPGFAPVSIPNQAVALGAARGSFQEGLLLKEREVAFGALDELIEFVRRVFLSSGGGDEGQTPGPPLPPEDQDRGPAGEPEQFFGEGEDLGELLAFQVREAYEDLPSYSETVATRRSLWDLPSPRSQGMAAPMQPPFFSSAPLRRAASLLIHEMLSRLPDPSLGDAGTLSWLRAARALGQVTANVGLLFDEFLHRVSPGQENRVERLYGRLFHRPPHNRPQMYAALFHPSIGPAYYDLPPWDWYLPLLARESDPDPTALLQQIPVPLDLARSLDRGVFEAGPPSLFSLLLVALAAPRCLVREPRLADLLLLTACLVQAPYRGPALWNPYERTTLQEAQLNELQLTAAAWLKASLPSFVFPDELEEQIERAPSLRYATA